MRKWLAPKLLFLLYYVMITGLIASLFAPGDFTMTWHAIGQAAIVTTPAFLCMIFLNAAHNRHGEFMNRHMKALFLVWVFGGTALTILAVNLISSPYYQDLAWAIGEIAIIGVVVFHARFVIMDELEEMEEESRERTSERLGLRHSEF